MSERFNHQPSRPEASNQSPEIKQQYEKIAKTHEKTLNQTHEQTHENLQLKAQNEAISGKDFLSNSSETSQGSHQLYWDKNLKLSAFNKTMNIVRHRLSPREKKLSKIVHNTKVETVSTVAEKTIARPIGILVGSAISFIGSLIIILVAHRGGFEIRFSLFAILFVIGYGIGMLVEVLLFLTKRLKNRSII